MKIKNIFRYIFSFLGAKKGKKLIEAQLNSRSIEELRSRLNSLMERKKPFLQNGYHMKDMADDLQIPLHQLSAFINQVMGMHFTDYINQFRIQYCTELMKSGFETKTNLKDLAYKCGFNNRNSFTAAFKKFTGQKPSHYVKHLQNI